MRFKAMFGVGDLSTSKDIFRRYGTYLVSKQSIVAHDDQNTLKLFQIPLQCSKCIQIYIIRWLNFKKYMSIMLDLRMVDHESEKNDISINYVPHLKSRN